MGQFAFSFLAFSECPSSSSFGDHEAVKRSFPSYSMMLWLKLTGRGLANALRNVKLASLCPQSRTIANMQIEDPEKAPLAKGQMWLTAALD